MFSALYAVVGPSVAPSAPPSVRHTDESVKTVDVRISPYGSHIPPVLRSIRFIQKCELVLLGASTKGEVGKQTIF